MLLFELAFSLSCPTIFRLFIVTGENLFNALKKLKQGKKIHLAKARCPKSNPLVFETAQ